MRIKPNPGPYTPGTSRQAGALRKAKQRRDLAKDRAVVSGAYRFPLELPPSDNDLHKPAVVDGKAQMIQTREAKEYKARVRAQIEAWGFVPLAGELILHCVAHRPANRGDIGNYLKILKDSLNGYLWIDDAQIADLRIQKGPRNKARPHILIFVSTQDLPRPIEIQFHAPSQPSQPEKP